MLILSTLLGMLLVCGISGAALTRWPGTPTWVKRSNLQIGYAYTLVAFYSFYCLTKSAHSAVLLTIILPLLLASVATLWNYTYRSSSCSTPTEPPDTKLNRWGYPISISLIIVLLAAWPYFLSGWGHYWQTGNYDMEDGLNGRDAYVENLIFGSDSFDRGEELGDKLWDDFADKTGTAKQKITPNDSFKEWYASGGFRFQYSSLAFWSVLMGASKGIDILLVQGILNLILTAIGIYHLARHAFQISPLAASIAAFFSVANTFYLTTFLNGHIGSLMYGALIPTIIYGGIPGKPKTGNSIISIGMIILLLIAIIFTYPHPLVIISAPLITYCLLNYQPTITWINRASSCLRHHPFIYTLLIVAGLIFVCLFLKELWHLTEGYRYKQDSQYRAWGFTHDWLILPLILGLILPPMEGTVFAGSALSQTSYISLATFSGFTLILALLCYLKAIKKPPLRFLKVFLIFWILGYFIFRYFIVDSYYLYKFLYTHQFIFIIGVTAYLASTRSRWKTTSGLLLIAINIYADCCLTSAIYNRDYNQSPERHLNLLSLKREKLENSFIDLTGGDATAVRQTLKANNIQPSLDPRLAKFFVVQANRDSDITGRQFTNPPENSNALVLKEAPKFNYLLIRTYNEPEQYPSDPILGDAVYRWMSHEIMDYLGIYVVRPLLTDELRRKHLRICFLKGPSATTDIEVTVASADQKTLQSLVLSNGVQIAWIPAEQVLAAEQPLVIHSGARGKGLLPHDDRILLYRVFSVEWADNLYDDRTLAFLNNKGKDIIATNLSPQGTNQTADPSLHLGQGWSAYESFDGQDFRWAGDQVDLILTGNQAEGIAHLSIDLETGPSLNGEPLNLEVINNHGKTVAICPAVTGRHKIMISLPYKRLQTQVYTLKTKGQSISLPGEFRALNYRVFKIELEVASLTSI